MSSLPDEKEGGKRGRDGVFFLVLGVDCVSAMFFFPFFYGFRGSVLWVEV